MRETFYDGRWMSIEERDELRWRKQSNQSARSDIRITVMGDIRPFVTQDKVEITSRSHLRTYEQQRGVKQIGNDVKPPRLAGEEY